MVTVTMQVQIVFIAIQELKRPFKQLILLYMSVPMSGPSSALIVKEKWARMLLDGKKTWEIRSTSTTKRGKIAIAISGTGHLYGEVTLVTSKLVGYRTPDGRIVQGDIPDGVFIGHKDNRRRIEDLSVIKYPKIWAWVMKDPIKYDPPQAYKHVTGCVIWNPLGEAKSAIEKTSKQVTAVKKSLKAAVKKSS